MAGCCPWREQAPPLAAGRSVEADSRSVQAPALVRWPAPWTLAQLQPSSLKEDSGAEGLTQRAVAETQLNHDVEDTVVVLSGAVSGDLMCLQYGSLS